MHAASETEIAELSGAYNAADGVIRGRADTLFSAFFSLLPTLTVLSDRERLTSFETGAFILHRVVPLCAVLPDTPAQVATVLRICARLNVPVVTRGAGTGIAGGAIPIADVVLLMMTKLNAILEIDAAARLARVQPGVRNIAVSDAVAHLNLLYAPDPSSQIVCLIGGNVAENSGGVHCLKYGLTTHNIRRAQCISVDGEAITIGSHALDTPGYDLLALLTGSGGMLVANVFHAGDGNLHPCIFYDGTITGEAERSEKLGGKMLKICIEVGGTITGEHGVGIEKLKQMCVQFRAHELAMFHAVKEASDPARILNPEKGIPLLKRGSERGGMHASTGRIIHNNIPRF